MGKVKNNNNSCNFNTTQGLRRNNTFRNENKENKCGENFHG